MNLFLVLCLLLLLAGSIENLFHRRYLCRIKVRILVNGTRGKSATTRLIAAGLRAGGYRVIAKTTGTAARLILEDGSERAIRRWGRPSIIEQIRLVRFAGRRRADALVIECMALRPEYQWMTGRMIAATIGVITNVRRDHLDVMGPAEADAARALGWTIPAGGHLITAERRFFSDFARWAQAQGTTIHLVEEPPPEVFCPDSSYLTFGENIVCALKACQLAGVDREAALAGMGGAAADPGAGRLLELAGEKDRYLLVDAFAANDPDSTGLIWQEFLRESPAGDLPIVALLNARADRPTRTVDMARFLAEEVMPDRVALIGQNASFARRQLVRAGFPAGRISDLTQCKHPKTLLCRITSLEPSGAILLGLGNAKGAGVNFASYFARFGGGRQ